jgi:hypothetical protein
VDKGQKEILKALVIGVGIILFGLLLEYFIFSYSFSCGVPPVAYDLMLIVAIAFPLLCSLSLSRMLKTKFRIMPFIPLIIILLVFAVALGSLGCF